MYVQLVELPGGAVVGRFRQVSLGKDNKLSTLDAPISGAASGEQFVGKIEAAWHEGGVRAFSGKRMPGGLIQLTGAGGLRANLRPAGEDDETRALEALRQGAEQATAAKEKAEAKAQRQKSWRKRTEALQGIVLATLRYNAMQSLSFRKYTDYPARYEATTAKLEDLLAQVKAARGDTGELIGRRSTLTASMFHTSIDETQHPHIEVRHAYEDSMREWQRLDELLVAASKVCQEPTPPDIDTQSFKKDCGRVPQLTQSLKTAGENSKTEFFKIRDVYQRELSKQEALRADAESVRRGTP
ncbi:hypothetical protein ABIC63_003410 [Pseudacidovorax sp. 1753]|uniref:hypothetical protein n=1 Tax=Pseudacidovorax sp. 1753 TaxID=3156419 RepID=UPI0033946F71